MTIIRNTRQKSYTDIDMSLKNNSFYGDIVVLKDEDAIKNSIRNLIITSFGQRPFEPYLSSIIPKLLFAKPSTSVIISIKESISQVLVNEPRIDVFEIDVINFPSENAYSIDIYYALRNSDEVETLNIPLKRTK